MRIYTRILFPPPSPPPSPSLFPSSTHSSPVEALRLAHHSFVCTSVTLLIHIRRGSFVCVCTCAHTPCANENKLTHPYCFSSTHTTYTLTQTYSLTHIHTLSTTKSRTRNALHSHPRYHTSKGNYNTCMGWVC